MNNENLARETQKPPDAEGKPVFLKPACMTDRYSHYCPGCPHGIVHRIIGNIVDDSNLRERVVGVAPVGCAVFAYWYFDFDFMQAAHGRAPAVATGIKRAHPELTVFTYQGDGDLAAIGTAEIIHAANRGENITVIFINNAIYGMTGGQMAPTTLLGQKTLTTPYGRDSKLIGYPIKVVELLAPLEGVKFAARTSTHNFANIVKTEKALRRAFEVQAAKEGFAIVEVLSTCNTNWGMSPVKAMEWLRNEMIPVFPLGVLKDTGKAVPVTVPAVAPATATAVKAAPKAT